MELWDNLVTIVDNYFQYLELEYGFRKASDKSAQHLTKNQIQIGWKL